MGYDHSMSLRAQMKKGVTLDQVAEAIAPLLKYLDAEINSPEPSFDDEFLFDPETGVLSISTGGEVKDSYFIEVEEVALRLGKIVEAAGEIQLRDHSTGDLDNAISVIEFGPSSEAIRTYKAERDIAAAMDLMKPYLPENKIDEIRALIKS